MSIRYRAGRGTPFERLPASDAGAWQVPRRVNAVAPGVIRTPMHAAARVDLLAGFHPMNTLGEVEDIVRAVLYLEGAVSSTGEILHVDGGLIAGH